MIRRALLLAALAALAISTSAATAWVPSRLLPSGWHLSAPKGPLASTGTMPQGLALSPGGGRLAVVESGFNPPALRVLEARSLRELALVPLPGAFGRPVWADRTHVLVAGANAGALLWIDLATKHVRALPVGTGSWPDAVALAPNGRLAASSNDGDGTVSIGRLGAFARARRIAVGAHPGDLCFSAHGRRLFVAMRGGRTVEVVDVASGEAHAIAVGLHPSALALSRDGSRLYVALADADALATVNARTGALLARTPLGLHDGRLRGDGASPNALAVGNGRLYVSLGAQNAVAVVANGAVAARLPTGWYPTGVALGADRLYVTDGKGEGMRANPQFDPRKPSSPGYIAATLYGSVREIALHGLDGSAATRRVLADAMPAWSAPATSVLRAHGPIHHVIYVIKENRSYDQVLGDVAGADGDPRLAWFGRRVTPNQHALASRFGIFDNAYANAQVSADGHNWTDAAFANDYVERFWPVDYGGRRALYDFQNGNAPVRPRGGFLWDDAKRAGISYRDYGEDVDSPRSPGKLATTSYRGLAGHFDPRYYGWDLHYSDLARFAEWKREFDKFVAHHTLPQLEIVYLPNDHTAGTRPGSPTPVAYVATNDWAVGQLVDAVSHSPYWRSTAMFILEDDAQNGPDHVSDQRSTFYVASPYALPGVHHAHYSTAGFLRSIEILLGLPPMSIYDATALPLYAAFGAVPHAAPFDAVRPQVDLRAVNSRTAYGAAISARMDFSHPDAVNPVLLDRILARAHGSAR